MMFDIAIATLKDELSKCENIIDEYKDKYDETSQFMIIYKEDIKNLKAAIEVLKNYEVVNNG